jgi:diguanylate cyclase (GGDEF)-like protein/PAS domain S-box-containing protein
VRTLDAHLAGAFAYFPDAFILADGEARVSYLNPVAEQMLGLSLEKARGQVLDKVLNLQDGVTRQSIQIGDFPGQHMPFSGAFHLLVRNGGGAIPVQCSVALIRNGSGATGSYMIVLRNASGLQLYIDKLVTQSMHDEHSRLLRRAELVKRLWRLLQETDEGETQAFMYLDLDNFKSVNDTAGHAAGDLAIRQIASRLKDVVRGRDTLARLGGDEFGLLLERCPAERARQRAEQLHRVVESYVLHWNGETFRLGVSIGLAIFKTHKHSLNAILAAADTACYQAKRNGGVGPHIQEIVLD